jgi:serine/threonine protein kinase
LAHLVSTPAAYDSKKKEFMRSGMGSRMRDKALADAAFLHIYGDRPGDGNTTTRTLSRRWRNPLVARQARIPDRYLGKALPEMPEVQDEKHEGYIPDRYLGIALPDTSEMLEEKLEEAAENAPYSHLIESTKDWDDKFEAFKFVGPGVPERDEKEVKKLVVAMYGERPSESSISITTLQGPVRHHPQEVMPNQPTSVRGPHIQQTWQLQQEVLQRPSDRQSMSSTGSSISSGQLPRRSSIQSTASILQSPSNTPSHTQISADDKRYPFNYNGFQFKSVLECVTYLKAIAAGGIRDPRDLRDLRNNPDEEAGCANNMEDFDGTVWNEVKAEFWQDAIRAQCEQHPNVLAEVIAPDKPLQKKGAEDDFYDAVQVLGDKFRSKPETRSSSMKPVTLKKTQEGQSRQVLDKDLGVARQDKTDDVDNLKHRLQEVQAAANKGLVTRLNYISTSDMVTYKAFMREVETFTHECKKQGQAILSELTSAKEPGKERATLLMFEPFSKFQESVKAQLLKSCKEHGWEAPNQSLQWEGAGPLLVVKGLSLEGYTPTGIELGRGKFSHVELLENSNGDQIARKVYRSDNPVRIGGKTPFEYELMGLQRLYEKAGPSEFIVNVYAAKDGELYMESVRGSHDGTKIFRYLEKALALGKTEGISAVEDAVARAYITKCLNKAAAHYKKADMVHSDIKPDNFMVDEDTCMVKLGDPGIWTETGTPAVGHWSTTAPPEAYDDGIVDSRSDVFTTGATLLGGMERFNSQYEHEVRNGQSVRQAFQGLTLDRKIRLDENGNAIRMPGTVAAETAYTKYIKATMATDINERVDSTEANELPLIKDSLMDDAAAREVLRKVIQIGKAQEARPLDQQWKPKDLREKMQQRINALYRSPDLSKYAELRQLSQTDFQLATFLAKKLKPEIYKSVLDDTSGKGQRLLRTTDAGGIPSRRRIVRHR